MPSRCVKTVEVEAATHEEAFSLAINGKGTQTDFEYCGVTDVPEEDFEVTTIEGDKIKTVIMHV